MAGRLIKYDFMAIGRKLGPIYIAVLAVSFLTGILGLRVTNSGPLAVVSFILGVLVIVMAVMTLVVLIQRFRKTVYGDEGYLMMTLPASTGTQLWSKVISAVIWGVLTTLVMLGSAAVIILMIRVDGGIHYREMLVQLNSMNLPWGKISLTAVLFILNAIAGLVEFALMIYASISVGSQASDHKGLFSVLAFIAFAVIENVILYFAVTKSDGLDSTLTVNLTTFEQSLEYLDILLFASLVVAVITSAVYFAVTYLFMDRRLNLE